MEEHSDHSAKAMVESFGDKAFTRAIIYAWQSADFRSREYWLDIALEIARQTDRVQHKLH